MTTLQQDFDHATSIMQMDLDETAQLLMKIITTADASEEGMKVQEQSIYKVADIYSKQGHADKIISLLDTIRPFFLVIPKARTAKIVRTLIDFVGAVPGAVEKEIQLCTEWIEWTKKERRTFLRHRLESKLASLFLETKQFRQALDIINRLLTEMKRLDDKAMLVEIQLLESRCHYYLQNLPKSKAALTSARTSANAIYVPPLLQAEIDVLAGTLHAEEKDYKTAYSYFYEAFENYGALGDDSQAVLCLKYMLMCKIMVDSPDDVNQLVSGKAGVRFSGRQVEAMRAIAAAYTERSLLHFEKCLEDFSAELKDDAIVHSHLSGLYETLLEQNLSRIVEPYSRVQIQRIAELINLSQTRVESKLSQMILDKKLNGILDQGSNCLILHSDSSTQEVYEATTGTFENMSHVVDSLFKKTLLLS